MNRVDVVDLVVDLLDVDLGVDLVDVVSLSSTLLIYCPAPRPTLTLITKSMIFAYRGRT